MSAVIVVSASASSVRTPPFKSTAPVCVPVELPVTLPVRAPTNVVAVAIPDTTKAHKYVDQFPNMFIMPKVMAEYGTVKPGFYFYSSEIIERLSLFGGMSLNSLMDTDLFFIF